jgi:hypothetical protein
MMGLFGKSKAADPKEQVNEWCKKIRKERSTWLSTGSTSLVIGSASSSPMFWTVFRIRDILKQIRIL